MSKDTVSAWDTTPANNTDVGGVDLAENSMRPRDVNNAIRTMMAQIKTFIGGVFSPASSSSAAYLDFHEDTDNGANRVRLIAPASIAADVDVTLPGTADTLVGRATTDTLSNKTLVTPVLGSATATSISVTNNTNGSAGDFITNTNGGTSAAAWLQFLNGTGNGYFGLTGTGYTLVPILQGRVAIDADANTNGMVLNCEGADPILFAVAGAELARFTATGAVLSIGGGSLGRGAPVTKTANFSVADTENWLINNKSGSSCTVTLPAAGSYTGREIMLKTIQAQTTVSASSNVVPLGGGAAGTAILSANAGRWATLVSNGTNWEIMAGVV